MYVKPSRRTGRRLGRCLSIAALALGAAGGGATALPAVASASTYNVYLCTDGYGGGLFGTAPYSTASDFGSSVNCTQPTSSDPFGKGDGISVWSTAPANAGQFAYWVLDSPGDTTITNLSYTGVVSAWGGWTAQWVAYFGPNRTADLTDVGGGDDCPTTSCNTGVVVGVPLPPSVAISGATRIGVGVFCHAAGGCPANSSLSMFGPAGSIDVWKVTLTIDEPAAPAISAIGGTVYSEDPTGWISDRNAPNDGSWNAVAQASDPSGVCVLNLSVGGLSASNDVTPNFGSTTPCQTGTPQATVDLNPCQPGGLGPGSYTASASASNPAGMVSSMNGGTFNVECSGPSLSVLSTEDLGRWYPGPQTVAVNASDQSGLQGPVSCTVGQQPSVAIQPSQLPYALPVTQNGSSSVNCSAENNVNYTTSTALNGLVKIDSQTPSLAFSGATPAPAWVSGPHTITATGSETQQLSGIASVSCQLDDGGWTTTDGAVASVKLANDGVHTVSCYATSGAGVSSPTETDTIQIDSVGPSVSFSGGPSQSSWSTTAQSIDVTATKPAGTSGVAQISCTLNEQTNTYANDSSSDSQTVKITVQPPGGDLSCKAQDNAGNWSAPQAWNFLIDDTTPAGQFLASDPSDPTQVRVQVADAISGIQGVQIELQTATGWQPLATSFDAASGIATATIPDDGTLQDGTYQLQALVWSVAGDEATITQGSASTPAAVTLPLRIVTQLLVGPVQAEASAASCTTARIVLRRADAARHRALAARLVRRCAEIKLPRLTPMQLRYGQKAAVSGLLETIDGTPLPAQTITILQQAEGWSPQAAGSVVTDGQGRFTDTLAAGASRTVTFSYAGTAVLRASSASTGVRVVGKSTIQVGKHAVAGRQLRISGRLYGGYVPTDGVLVQLWYRVKGVPDAFAPFDHAIHTTSQGTWSVTFPISPRARGYTYLFKAVIAQQSGWPFLATSTSVVSRHVT